MHVQMRAGLCVYCLCVFNQCVLVYMPSVIAELKEKAVDYFDLDDHMILKHLSTETQLPEGFDVITKYVPLPCAFVSISLNYLYMALLFDHMCMLVYVYELRTDTSGLL